MRSVVTLGLLSLIGSCDKPESPIRTSRDASVADAGDGRPCSPPCPSGEVCDDGACFPRIVDADDDNIVAAMDCDDRDPTVGRMFESMCMSACGPGIERCMDGQWEPCTAPTVCDCRDTDAPRMLDCGSCGMQRQECIGGQWTDVGECDGRGECRPGDMRVGGRCSMCGMEVQICGDACSWNEPQCEGMTGECAPSQREEEMRDCMGCGGGTQRRSRSCEDNCMWGDWSDWGMCENTSPMGECMAGAMESEERECSAACGSGMQMRTRMCGDNCMWDDWTDWSICSNSMGECSPGATRPCEDMRDSPCTVEVCGMDCTWGECGLRDGAECDHVADDGRAGARWRCCMPGMSFWQYCLDTCMWSSACEVCSTSCDRCTMSMP